MALSTYPEVLEYLYQNLPMFQRVGAIAFKKDLTNTLALCERLSNPQNKFPTVHVAGTNGKGSTSHMVASILQSAGYKTGLYTSPHLKEFTERIRVNGTEVSQAFVVDFVQRMRTAIGEIKPSFFEITVAMAFDFFAQEKVDIAVIEVGLGGRLDSTNVITPLVSVITNIGWDHQDLLGDTLEKIAGEKAGIIKTQVPVVVSQRQPGIDQVFTEVAASKEAPLSFANETYRAEINDGRLSVWDKEEPFLTIESFPLPGLYQQQNVPGVLQTIDRLRETGWKISDRAVAEGLTNVVEQTFLKGRWQKIGHRPLIFCDTGHNIDGIREVVRMIRLQHYDKLYIVLGMVKDKDVSDVLAALPKDAYYFFCQARIPRAMDAAQLMTLASKEGLQGEVVQDVNRALEAARHQAHENDFVFVGGSTFVVAELNEI